GFPRTRESFKGKTGISFDPFSAASTASEMTISLLLNPKRLNRIMIQNSIDSSKMSLRYVLNRLISNSFKKTHKDSYISEVQHLINTNILIYLLNISEDEEAFMQVKHEAKMAVKYLQRLIAKSKKIHAYYDQYSYIIEDFKKRPELYKKQRSSKIPDGSPIGSESCNYNL
ncbi:MAG: peptidase, partial [Flavobacteriaceae bacterium]|nr:peptidase [Flavobacteriaceae bacterium]